MYYSDSERVTPKLGDNALRVLRKRYLRGETPEQMFWRIASHIAEAERAEIKSCSRSEVEENFHMGRITTIFYNLMATLDFLPNSPTIMNAGRRLGQLSGCFVLPIEDSMDGIFDAIKNMALVQKAGGGTGFSFNNLRPSGDPVTSTVGEASGPVSFMEAFNACTEAIKQGGARRGANMGILRIDHPDIMEFVEIKSDLTKLTNFNMSVAITDEFIDCLVSGKLFTLRWNDTEYAKIDARALWDRIVYRAWQTGEPGIIFIDAINNDNPTPMLGAIESTNPCGEQPLLPFESCNLGSINLSHMVKIQPAPDRNPSNNIDWDRLEEAVRYATRFLDNVIDMNHYPLPEIERMTKGNRKIGLGVMGWGDLLFQLELPYDCDQARLLAGQIMEFIQKTSHQTSMLLAEERGVFPNWAESKWGLAGIPMRNAATITIAPTGTLSVVADCSSGIEPLFGLSFQKELVEGVTEGGTLKMVNPYVVKYLNRYNIIPDVDYAMNYIKENGTLKGCSLYPEAQEIFKCASDIAPSDHIKMQAAFQKYTDNAVSKTINFDNDVSPEDIGRAMLLAFELGCKGVTVYRDGSRNTQPLKKGTTNSIDSGESNDRCATCEYKSGTASSSGCANVINPGRLEEVSGITKKVRTGCGSMFVTINDHDNDVYEVFLRTGNTGGCAAFTDGTARLISIALRYGVPVGEIIQQLNSVRCDNFRHQTGKDPSLQGKSCPDVVGRVMAEVLQKLHKSEKAVTQQIISIPQEEPTESPNVPGGLNECPECHKLTLERTEGCLTCRYCGYSHC